MTYRVLLKPGWQAIPDAGIIVRNRWLRGLGMELSLGPTVEP